MMEKFPLQEGRRGREESAGETKSSPRDRSHFRGKETQEERERQLEREGDRDEKEGEETP